MKSKAFDVVVVGGGIIGTSAAYYLARSGKRVALLEKGIIGGGQSGRNWGSVRTQGRARAELPLMIEAIKIWSGLEAELKTDLHWRQHGQMLIAYEQARMKSFEAFLPLAHEFELDTRIVSPADITEVQPGFCPGRDCLGAMFTSTDGCAEPTLVASAFARAAMRLGAEVIENCALLSVATAAGAVHAVETANRKLRADAVIIAAGASTTALLSPLGVFHPSLLVRGTVAHARFCGDSPALREMVVWGKSAIRYRPDGTIILAASEDGIHQFTYDSIRIGWRFVPLAWRNRRHLRISLRQAAHNPAEPTPDMTGISRAADAFHSEYPGSSELKIIRTWAGDIDYTPDELPIIDALAVDGLFVAAGFSGDGFGLGPAAGREIAQWICTGQPRTDLTPFRASRFRPLLRNERNPYP